MSLQAALAALFQAISRAKKKAMIFKKTLEDLESTLKSVRPMVEPVNWPSTDMLSRFVQHLEKAKTLIDMYYNISMLDVLKKRKIRKQIQAMNTSLRLFLKQDLQVQEFDNDVIEMNMEMDNLITGRGGSNFRANLALGLDAAELAVDVASLAVDINRMRKSVEGEEEEE